MKTQYKTMNLRPKTLELIEQANQIIDEYQEQGFELTVRQIYYQFVARGLISNSMESYLLIGRILNHGRMCGLIDWHAIIDRTRSIYGDKHWDSPQEILDAAAATYKLDTREDQDYYIEVWIEKNALLGVIEPICRKLDITYLPCIGYYSLSSMWRAALRFNNRDQDGIILHLGDHDPSGLDMTRDIKDRLDTFGVTNIEVIRIALNMDQVEEYNPPSNPAKLSDSRAGNYIQQYGHESWELDALSPEVIADLIKDNVDSYTDFDRIQTQLKLQKQQRKHLQDIADNNA
ncbi:hypothetical protein LCGC14_1573930 [marine sediment metagenome]|uniref:DUF2399 domain-containing protein n=1 Tax=marine sediment metagenome TaxID=412755 RepID=A0A0F9LJ99_9ZZZZ